MTQWRLHYLPEQMVTFSRTFTTVMPLLLRYRQGIFWGFLVRFECTEIWHSKFWVFQVCDLGHFFQGTDLTASFFFFPNLHVSNYFAESHQSQSADADTHLTRTLLLCAIPRRMHLPFKIIKLANSVSALSCQQSEIDCFYLLQLNT